MDKIMRHGGRSCGKTLVIKNEMLNSIWHDAMEVKPDKSSEHDSVKEILICRDGNVLYGLYLGDMQRLGGWERGRFVYEEIRLEGDFAQSFVVIDNFREGDKWAYMKDFIPNKTITEL